MDRQKLIRELLVTDLQRCEDMHKKMISQLKVLPAGSISNRKGELCRFVRENGKQYLVPIRKDFSLLKKLKLRRIIKCAIPKLEKHIKITRQYLDNQVFYDPEEIAASLPEQYHGLNGINVFLEGDLNVDEWYESEYKKNGRPFKNPQYTAAGIKCRSKSEAMIGSKLEELGIKYHYEPELVLGGQIIYPDFEILNESRRRLAYYEHFGLIDNPEYAEMCFRKLELYEQNGYYLGFNLFFTYETRWKPLSMKTIESKIREIMHPKI